MSERTASERAAAEGFEIRTVGEVRVDLAEDRRIRGMAIIFNQRSVNLGGFVEIIAPEAVDRTLREAGDVRALIDHDTGKVMGRTKSGTLELKKDRTGLKVVIDPPNTSYAKDIMESLNRGDVSGMSFRFRVMPGGLEWEVDEDTGVHVRTVTDMTFDEISIVPFPAYEQTDVTVAMRSMRAFQAERPHRSLKSVAQWIRTQRARE